MTTIYRGDNTRAFGSDFLRIYLNNPNNLEISKAVVQINNDIEKIYDYPQFPIRVNFTGDETEQLNQQNVVKMAVWDANGRRRTAEGKFTFLVKENRINEQDNPIDDYDSDYAPPEYSITFDLSDTEFAAQFSINATPSAMSELINDVNYLCIDNIIQGDNIKLEKEGNTLIINADADIVTDYDDLDNIPTVNGTPLRGDLTSADLGLDGRIDWEAEDGPSSIINKPDFATVAFTGNYNDLLQIPNIPKRVSDLLDANDYVKQTTLSNYVTISNLNELIEPTPVITDIYAELNNRVTYFDFQTGLLDKVSILDFETQLQDKASKDFVTSSIQNTVDGLVSIDDFNNALALKLDRSDLGRSNLNIYLNGSTYTFNADQQSDVDVEINIPTKLSELENDVHYTTETEIGLDNLVTQAQFQELDNRKINRSEVGDGTITLTINNNVIDSFALNQSGAKTIDLHVPTNVSELENDASYVDAGQLSSVQQNLDFQINEINLIKTEIHAINEELQDKVTAVMGKSLVSNDEIERLSHVDNYDDTLLVQQVNDNTLSINELQENKVDKVPGKGLSTNDYTDEDKEAVTSVRLDLTDIRDAILANSQKISNVEVLAGNAQITADNNTEQLNIEHQQRTDEDTALQAQITALREKASVVDYVQDHEALMAYNTALLNKGDIIVVLEDETQHNATTTYIFEHPSFNLYKKAPETYTKDVSDSKFALKELLINNHNLYESFDLTAEDVGALPSNTVIGDGELNITINNQYVEGNTFNANATDSKTINLRIPYDTSELTNNGNYINASNIEDYMLVVDISNNETVKVQNLFDKHYGLIYDNADKIAVNTRNIELLQNIVSPDGHSILFDGDYDHLINLPDLPKHLDDLVDYLQNDIKFVTQYSLEANFVTKDMLPTKVSELENDRGYVTTNAIGRGILTFKINGNSWTNNTWMANEKYDQTLDIPTENHTPEEVRASGSTLPPQAITVYNETKRIDDSCVHIGQAEHISGDKTFDGTLTATNVVTLTNDVHTTKTVALDNVSDLVVNSKWVKDFTDLNVVHKTGNTEESITGHKIFVNLVTLNEAVGLTRPITSLDTHLATTKFVDNYYMQKDATLVHKTGNLAETITGNKTFEETVSVRGNTVLGRDYFTVEDIHVTIDGQDIVVPKYTQRELQPSEQQRLEALGGAIAPTMPTAENSNAIATTAFVKNQDYATNTLVSDRIRIVEKSIDLVSDYALKLQVRVDGIEADYNKLIEENPEILDLHAAITRVNATLETALQVAEDITNIDVTIDEKMTQIDDKIADGIQQLQDTISQIVIDSDAIQSAVDALVDNAQQSLDTALDTATEEINQLVSSATSQLTKQFNIITCGSTTELVSDTVNSLINTTQTTTINLPTVSDNIYHEILVQINLQSGTVRLFGGNEYNILDEAGIYDVKFMWHHPSNIWVCKIEQYEV